MASTQSSVWRRLASATARRITVLLTTVLLAALVSAALVRLAPGFGMDERLLDLRRSEEGISSLRARPTPGVAEAFVTYLSGLLRGDWGTSISLNRPVRELFAERATLTARTLAIGLTVAWLLAFSLAATLEVLHRQGLDAVATVASGAVLCLPAAVVALVFVYLNAGPPLALAVILAPRLFRYVRNILQAVSARPHVLAARARGAGPAGLLWRHVCVPATSEMLALAGVSVSMAVGAAIPIEALCDSPGVGQLMWQSAMARDLPVLMHLTVLVALAVSAANLVSDAARATAEQGA